MTRSTSNNARRRFMAIYRDLEAVASEHGFVYANTTSRGHFQWRHKATGRIVVTGSKPWGRALRQAHSLFARVDRAERGNHG
jgi:hypothetical protein